RSTDRRASRRVAAGHRADHAADDRTHRLSLAGPGRNRVVICLHLLRVLLLRRPELIGTLRCAGLHESLEIRLDEVARLLLGVRGRLVWGEILRQLLVELLLLGLQPELMVLGVV